MVALHVISISEEQQALWRCLCDCGSEITVKASALNKGRKKSCGCLRIVHGECAGKQRQSKEYSTWQAIKQRCHNAKHFAYPAYGALGIQVCPEWRRSFAAFLRDMGRAPLPDLSINRIDPSKGYEPGNCAWATPLEQGENHANSRLLVFKDEVFTVAQAARRFGFNYETLRCRLRQTEWDLAQAISMPLRSHMRSKRGERGSPEYRAWQGMRRRCLNRTSVGYPVYGGAGITICARWSDFANFLSDMGRKPSTQHTLDRKDSRGNYEPSNCRWATRWEQAQNRTGARIYEHGGESMTLREWATRLGVQRRTLAMRIARGATIAEALSSSVSPPDRRGRRYEIDGRSTTLPRLAARAGKRYGTVVARLKKGWTLRDALNTPIRRAIRHHKVAA